MEPATRRAWDSKGKVKTWLPSDRHVGELLETPLKYQRVVY